MKKYFTEATAMLKTFLLLLSLCLTGSQGFATTWTTFVAGDITNLHNWTNGPSSPTSFTTPGDLWSVTLDMTMPSSGVWTVGTSGMIPASVTLSPGGTIKTNGGGAAPVINIYGNLIGSGGTDTVFGGGAVPVINVYGNVNITSSSFCVMGGAAHGTFNVHGNFLMSGGAISVYGGACNNRVNLYGNSSFTGTGTIISSGGIATGSVHFSLPTPSGTMLIDNSCTSFWGANIDVLVDTGCTAQLDGDFTTSTAADLTVNGALICPAIYAVIGTNEFNLNSSGKLIVGHATGINGAITTTGPATFNDTAGYGYNGLVAQVTGTYLPATLYAHDTIFINNTLGVTLTQSTSSTGVLAFNSGILYTGAYALTLPGAAGSVTGAGATNFVNGTLVKTIAGDTAVNYEVGDLTYAPMSLAFNAAGTAGSIALKVNNGLHPSVGSSTLSSAHMANHYWTITTNSPAGPDTVKPKATYYLADIIGGSDSFFVTQQYAGSLWLLSPLATTNTSSPYTSATDSGIALAALPGDYIFGRRTAALNVNNATGITNAVLKVFPDPNDGNFIMDLLSENNEEVRVVITNTIGQTVKEFTTTTNKTNTIMLSEPAGVYSLSAYTAHGNYSAKVLVK